MDKLEPNIVGMVALGLTLGLLPFVVVTMTGFLKISVVLFLIRNALGIQQIPPNMVLYAIALVLTVYVTSPVFAQVYAAVGDPSLDFRSAAGWQEALTRARVPVRDHLLRFTHERERRFFVAATVRVWPEPARQAVTDDDLIILVPSFIASELTQAFEIGFLLYLPFIVIDLVVANVLMAMGMMMVSPALIAVPFKLFLFVIVEGWSRLMHGLILSYG